MPALADQIRVIDTDTHVIEPPDLWTSRLASKWGERRPHVSFEEGWGMDRWRVGDRWLNPVGQYDSAGWKEHSPSYPPTLEEADPAGYDSTHRLQRMDEYGLYAQVLYPNIIGFDSQAFIELGDPELTLDCVRAYNDFLTDFASADPNRLLPVCMLPFWDVDACVTEMRRCRDNGHRGILWAAKLHVLGYPRINTRHWDQVYAAAQDLDMSLNLHIGIGAFTAEDTKFRETNREKFNVGAYVVESAVSFTSNMQTIGTLLVSDVFERFPRLQVVSVESGWGYLPYLIESLDWQWRNSSGPITYPNRRLPSEKFFTNMYGTFWFERQTLDMLKVQPEYADRIMFETDFPHQTSLSPGPASAAENPKVMIDKHFADMPADIVRKVLHDNAARLYHVE
jgi:predicted TIM-barrel fold metal-dependent hydrolase